MSLNPIRWTTVSFCVAFAVLTAAPAFAAFIPAVIETPNMDDVFSKARELKASGKSVLVAFDTDNTLLVLCQTLGSEQWFETENKSLGRHNFMNLLDIYDDVIKASCAYPTEAGIGEKIEGLEKEGISAMVVTSRGPVLADATVRQLSESGFSFNITGDRSLAFAGGREIKCVKGVCLTQGQDKGKSLLAFLKETGISPTAVIFVDNDPGYPNGHHKKMLDAVQAAGEPFDLYRYRYSREDYLFKQYQDGDEARAAAVAELADFKAKGCLQGACSQVMSDGATRQWLERHHCASLGKTEAIPLMAHLLYGDPLPFAPVCSPEIAR